MKSLEELYKELEEHKDLDVPGNIDKFLEASDGIFLHNDAKSIPVLLKYFVDDSDYDWIYEELSLSILRMPEEESVPVLVYSIKSFFEQSPEWCVNTFCTFFNDQYSVMLFKKNIHLADVNSLFKLFNKLADEYPHHKDLIAELRKELN